MRAILVIVYVEFSQKLVRLVVDLITDIYRYKNKIYTIVDIKRLVDGDPVLVNDKGFNIVTSKTNKSIYR